MIFEDLVAAVGDEPLFETGLLLAGDVDAADVRRQLSRWVGAGKVVQLRRGLYALAPPYRKTEPHPYLVANRLVRPSYVSCQTVLAATGLIPEHVPVTVSVTTGRPGRWSTAFGDYVYRHVKPDLFFGYFAAPGWNGSPLLAASPEKALLDLAYLDLGEAALEVLVELRLQNLDRLDLERLQELAEHTGVARLRRVAERVAALAAAERVEYESL